MHLKNFSLKETKPGNRKFRLSQAYDMLSVNIIMPEDKDQLALALNGKKRNIRKKDFYIFGKSCGILKNEVLDMLENMILLEDNFLSQISESYLDQKTKEQVKDLIKCRIAEIC